MTARPGSKRLLIVSVVALLLAITGVVTGAYAALSGRVMRWGDSLIIGPRFSGSFSLDGGTTKLRFWREDGGSPVLDAPSWKGRGPITMTFFFGYTIYHTPPGTLAPAKAAQR